MSLSKNGSGDKENSRDRWVEEVPFLRGASQDGPRCRHSLASVSLPRNSSSQDSWGHSVGLSCQH